MGTPEKITQEGTYDVMILKPYWEDMGPKDGDANRMAAVLPGHTEDGKYIDAHVQFTRTIVTSGRNAGKPLYIVSADQLHELGMPRPFNPADLDKLDGVTCEFVVDVEEYKGKPVARVKFINAQRRKKLDASDAANVWAKFTGGKESTAPTKPAGTAPAKPTTKPADDDDLPF